MEIVDEEEKEKRGEKEKEETTSSKTILIDINVANCTIRGAKPIGHFQNDPILSNEVEKIIWWKNVNPDRLHYRVYGELKDRALRKAQKIVNTNGSISTSGEYGSITIQAHDFVPFDWNEIKE